MLIQRNIAFKWARHAQRRESERRVIETLTCPHCLRYPYRTRQLTAEGWTPWQLTAHECPQWHNKIELGPPVYEGNRYRKLNWRRPRSRKEPVAVYTMICR